MNRAWPALLSVVIAASPSAQEVVPRSSLAEELRLDGVAEDFAPFRSILVGRDGRIVVPQMADYQLRVYDSAGRRVATLGRQGSGPGEFPDNRAETIGWVGDTLWVYSFNARRLTLFSPHHTVARAVPIVYKSAVTGASAPSFVSSGVLAVFADGAMLADAQFRVAESREGSSWDVRYAGLAPDATYQRTVAARPPPSGNASVCADGACYGASVPFAPQSFVDVAADGSRLGFVTTTIDSRGSGEYTLTVLGANGDTLVSRAFPFTGMRVPARARDSALADVRARLDSRGRASVVAEQLLRNVRDQIPSVYAPVVGFRLGDDGTIWIELHAESSRVWRMLDSRGAPVVDIALPRAAQLARATATRVWTIERDADEIPSVARYRISR